MRLTVAGTSFLPANSTVNSLARLFGLSRLGNLSAADKLSRQVKGRHNGYAHEAYLVESFHGRLLLR
jgi:hypothetical protein